MRVGWNYFYKRLERFAGQKINGRGAAYSSDKLVVCRKTYVVPYVIAYALYDYVSAAFINEVDKECMRGDVGYLCDGGAAYLQIVRGEIWIDLYCARSADAVILERCSAIQVGYRFVRIVGGCLCRNWRDHEREHQYDYANTTQMIPEH